MAHNENISKEVPALGAHGAVSLRDTGAYYTAIDEVTGHYGDGSLPVEWTTDSGEPTGAMERVALDAIKARMSPHDLIERGRAIQGCLNVLASRTPTGRGKNRAVRRKPLHSAGFISREAWVELAHELRTGERLFGN